MRCASWCRRYAGPLRHRFLGERQGELFLHQDILAEQHRQDDEFHSRNPAPWVEKVLEKGYPAYAIRRVE